MNTPAKTSHEHAARTTPRRTPPPTTRLSSKSNPRFLVLPLLALTTLVSLTRAASPSPRAALTLNLPHVPTTCDILNLTWTGGTANYSLLITQAHSSIPIQSWPALANTSVLWTVSLCGGTSVSLTLSDAGGYKSAVSFAVQYGSDGSCLSTSQRASNSGCVFPASASSTKTSSASAKSTANTSSSTGGSKAAGGPKLATVVGVVVGVVVLLVLWASCLFTRRRQRRGVGVLGPGSRPYFVRHERDSDRVRRRDTLLEMPPPMYQDASANASLANAEQRPPEHPSNSSLSQSLSVSDHDQTRPLMHIPEPETVQMAQLPSGRIEPELLPTPFVSPYEGSFTSASAQSEGTGHAREHTVASISSVAVPEVEVPSRGGVGEGVHDGGAGGDEPPPPYTLTA